MHFRNPPCPHLAALPKNAYGEDDTHRWLVMQVGERVGSFATSLLPLRRRVLSRCRSRRASRLTSPPRALHAAARSSYTSPVAQRLGSTLSSLAAPGGGCAPWPTVAAVAAQALDALAYVHAKRHVYVDINAENFMTGPGAPRSTMTQRSSMRARVP